jgi:lipopolysaccharide export system protein LptA
MTSIRQTARILAAAAFLCTLCVGATFAQSADKKGGGLFDSLAGPNGGSVRFQTAKGPDGEPAVVRAKTAESGEFAGLEAKGQLTLTTPQFKLECENLTFDGPTQKMNAWGNVKIDQEGVRASGGRLTYDSATREIRILENPDVTQSTEENTTHFTGMDEFVIVTKDDGSSEVRLTGDAPIQMETISKEPSANAPAPTGDQAAGGMGALGKNVKILVSPLGNVRPTISTSITDSALDTFRAAGSVRVDTDDFSLRADKLEFEGKKQLMTATSNVFLKQGEIDSDCGRMQYDLSTDVITLTVNPVVRQGSPTGRTVIKQLDSFIIRRQSDGTVYTEMVGGPDGSPDIFYEQAAPPTPPRNGKPNTDPIEIIIDDPASSGKIR